jgi:integrase
VVTVQGITAEVFKAAVPKLRTREKAPRPGQPAELKPKGWKNLFGCIHPFITWEIQRGNLTVDPTLGTETPTKAELRKARPIRKPWPDSEYEATLAKISFRDMMLTNGTGSAKDWGKLAKFTVKLLRWGGVDVNEAYRIQAHHIEEDSAGNLWIKKIRGKSKAGSAVEIIKLPISSKLEKEAREYWVEAMAKGPETPWLPWHTRFADHESFRSWVWKMIQKARARAGLPPRDVKSFRHTFVTYHLKRGKVKLSQLREWLGHADDSRMIEDTYDLSEHGAEAMD